MPAIELSLMFAFPVDRMKARRSAGLSRRRQPEIARKQLLAEKPGAGCFTVRP